MKQNQIKLIKYLMSQNKPVTSHTIAAHIGVSTRTVKSFIKEINETADKKIILSSKMGYRLINGYTLPASKKNKSIPQTLTERSHFIIKSLLIDHKELNVFDLCEDLYISYSTLKLNISQMNKTFERFGVKFIVEEGLLHVLGSEQNKRQLVSQIVFDETNSKFLDLKALEETFSSDKVQKMSQIVKSFFKSNHYYLNDFSYINLVLHFLILVKRVHSGQYINQDIRNLGLSEDSSLIESLSLELEEHFDILISKEEKAQIQMLIKTYVNPGIDNGLADLVKIVGQDNMDLIDQVIQDVNEVYKIDLNQDSFLVPFYLHMKGLFNRIKQNTYNKNPMLDSIKKECRIIYDIAIFISLNLENRFDVAVNEEETAFIALHVGAELERQKQNRKKISAVLLCPEYYNIKENLFNQLYKYFGNDIYMVDTVSQTQELEGLEFDLLISTVETASQQGYETIVVSPFNLHRQRHFISEMIEKIRSNEQKLFLQNNYQDFFHPSLFYVNPAFEERDQLFAVVCSDMQRLGFVSDAFEKEVREREHASSTAFGELALPHSMHMNAIKTCIAVIISKEGIHWDDGKKVNFVLLTAINHIDRSNFADIYEALISVFDNPTAIAQMKHIKSFKEFVDFIKQD